MSSEIFFIIASICIVILTALVSYVLLKLTKTIEETNIILDDVQQLVQETQNTAQTLFSAVEKLTSLTAIAAPLFGIIRMFTPKKKKK